MDSPKFVMKDESFVCEVCNTEVSPLKVTARNHCPHCLYSKHVDNNPGDRMCNCHGLLKPIGLVKHKDTYKIIFKCQKCGEIKKNITAKDDNINKIIELSSMPIEK
jgi:DNA-directed RNA polymerase subunit RPC12/RpoP